MTVLVTSEALVAALARTEAWAKDEQAKRHVAEDKLVEARSRAAVAEAALATANTELARLRAEGEATLASQRYWSGEATRAADRLVAARAELAEAGADLEACAQHCEGYAALNADEASARGKWLGQKKASHDEKCAALWATHHAANEMAGFIRSRIERRTALAPASVGAPRSERVPLTYRGPTRPPLRSTVRRPTVAESFIVLTRQIVGTSLSDLRCETYWDGEFHAKRQAAKKAGWKERGSDDFNIGVVRNGRLASVDWMDEPLGESADELAGIEEEIGLYEEADND